jgi:hypothetical protein
VKVRVFRAVTCQSSKVRWSGSWRSRSGAGAGGKYCDNLGTRSGKDTMTLRFTGPRLTLAYGAAKRGGSAVVLVDGRRRGVVDFAGRTSRPRFARFRAWSGLGRGEHTVRLVMRRGAGYVDDFLISGVARRG